MAPQGCAMVPEGGNGTAPLANRAGTPGQGAGTPGQGAGTPDQGAGTPDQGAGTVDQGAGTVDQGAAAADRGAAPQQAAEKGVARFQEEEDEPRTHRKCLELFFRDV